jgi:hypothetical protein
MGPAPEPAITVMNCHEIIENPGKAIDFGSTTQLVWDMNSSVGVC